MSHSVSAQAISNAQDLADFIAASPSSYHAAESVATRLSEAGYERLQEADEWQLRPGGRYVTVRDGAVIGWAIPEGAKGTTPFQAFGAHTDSPGFKMKPMPGTSQDGWLQAGVEVYGGPLLNSWLDRELRLAGRLALADGTDTLAQTGPLLRLPQLAIHLDRGVNDHLALDKQKHTQPVYGLADPSGNEVTEAELLSDLAASVEIDVADIRGVDAVLADAQRGELFGKDLAFFAAGRLDDLASVHAGVQALSAVKPQEKIAVLAAFDHEELGSQTRSGAAGPFLEDVLRRTYEALGASDSEYRRAVDRSWFLSSDVGHSVHPNYPEKHDPTVRPVLGSGPILKINGNQRYATDANGERAWRAWCEAAKVETQYFVSNNSVPCGSTIGPITSTRLGVPTVDVGIPILSMHSAREMAGTNDLFQLQQVAKEFFQA